MSLNQLCCTCICVFVLRAESISQSVPGYACLYQYIPLLALHMHLVIDLTIIVQSYIKEILTSSNISRYIDSTPWGRYLGKEKRLSDYTQKTSMKFIHM